VDSGVLTRNKTVVHSRRLTAKLNTTRYNLKNKRETADDNFVHKKMEIV